MTIARLTKDLAHLIKKNTTWQKTINLLQDFLNEEFARHEFVKDRSFGEHVYHKLEGMGLNDQNVLDLFQNFVKIDPEDIPHHISIKDFTIKLIEIAGENVVKPSETDPDKKIRGLLEISNLIHPLKKLQRC